MSTEISLPFAENAEALPLRRPRADEVPARDLGVVVEVEDDDGAVLADDGPVDDLLAPVPQLQRVGQPPLERDVGVAGLAGELAHRRVVTPLAGLDDLGGRAQAAALGEAGLGDPVELDQEVEVAVRVDPLSGLCHRLCPRPHPSLIRAPPSHRPSRMTTYSAGRTGASPISTTTCPSARGGRGVELLVDLDVERLRGRPPEQGPGQPDPGQELGDRCARAPSTARCCSARTPPSAAPGAASPRCRRPAAAR